MSQSSASIDVEEYAEAVEFEIEDLNTSASNSNMEDLSQPMPSDPSKGMISVQVPTSLCMQNKLSIHSRYCFVEQYVYPREPNIYIGNLYLRDE